MADITRADVVAIANSLIRDKCNSGIGWGTNAYPSGTHSGDAWRAPAGWFGGTTAGRSPALSIPAGTVDASTLSNLLKQFTNDLSRIRTMQITIIKSMNGYNPKRSNNSSWHAWTTQVYSGQTVGHSATPTSAGTEISGNLVGSTITLDAIRAACNQLYSNYVARSRNTIQSLTTTVCHYSCHSNCHSSRSRR